MTSSGSYDVRTANRDRTAELERLASQARLGWEGEAAILERFGFNEATSILEVGSGPGFVTRLLLDRFPGARVTCVEIDAELVNDARSYLDDYDDRVTFVHASVSDTGLAADSYDAAYARLLFQHLPDPLTAAREILRLLNGRAPFVIYDVDDGLEVLVDPDVPGLRSVTQHMAQMQAALGGNRFIGRRLIRMLKGAGFEQLDIEAVSANSQRDGIDAFRHQIDPGRLAPFIQAGVMSQEEVDELVRQRGRFLASDPFIMFVSLMAVGHKPA